MEKVGTSSHYKASSLDSETCAEVYALLMTSQYSVYEYARLANWLGIVSLKRAPKLEFYLLDSNGLRAVYRWGQSELFENAGYPMPPVLIKIVQWIKCKFKEDVNHAIAINYHSGVEQHAPPHKDKAIGLKVRDDVPLDMAKDSSFFVFSFGDPRVFTLQTTSATKISDRGVVWEKALAHGSLLRVSAADNRDLYHAVHKASKKSGSRYSLIFRNIVTMRPVNQAMEARANDPQYHFDPTA